VGDNSLIGIGAIVLNHAVIGENCIVGAGALVTERTVIPPNSLVVGSPAVVKKTLSEDVVEMLRQSAAHYIDNAALFAAALAEDDRV
jgi:carbonic anhydrase/acetyltransferase-like protein (isoleucine patch superfamily)